MLTRVLLGTVLASSAALVVGCSPQSVAEAEAQKNVAWLDTRHDRQATEALGRLADHEPQAAAILAARHGDPDAHHAAWLAHTRSAAWGDHNLHAALTSTDELPTVLPELPAHDPRLEAFASDLAQAVTLAPPPLAARAAGLLASLGAAAQPHVARLLGAEPSREAACTGLRSPETSPEGRMALTLAPPEARDLLACRTTIFEHAATDERVLTWLGTSGEPALLAGAVQTLPCPKVAAMWERSFNAERDLVGAVESAALGAATARCASALDPVLARAVPALPRVRQSILTALSLKEADVERLAETCKQLPRLRHGRAVAEDIRTLASRVYDERCKNKI